MRTIGEAIAPLKETIKAVKQDSFVTDRYVYALYLRYGKLLMRRQDSKNNLMNFSPVFQSIDYMELIDVDVVQACCIGLSSDCTIKRTKDRLPNSFDGYFGALLRSVKSVSMLGPTAQPVTNADAYVNMTKQKNFKFNKTVYYWYLDGYLYFPNVQWDAISLEGLFEGDVSKFNCSQEGKCIPRQEEVLNIPEYLDPEIRDMIKRDLGLMIQIPPDDSDDKKAVTR